MESGILSYPAAMLWYTLLMNQYDWILFDADETLFHFDAFAGLQRMFAGFGVTFTQDDFAHYQTINQPLWVDYQNGIINAQQLQINRFATWAARLEVLPQDLNHAFMNAMADICAPMDGVVEAIDALHGHVKLGIITNGFTQLQQIRLERTGLQQHFDALVISEQVGVAKPDRAIFDYALQLMDNPPRERVLMVGDTPESDILGGINAGFDTCWLDHGHKTLPTHIAPTYQISSMQNLVKILCTI